jgi:glycine cleavage system aminomethyltransferase T
MAFDMSLVQRGARLRRSPFYEAEQQYGPKGYTVYNHMLFPTNFDDFEAEYWHLLNHVTLWDVAVERNLEVQGRDGFRFAQLLTPRDLSKCAVGQGKYVLITAPDGGIVNDPVMLRLGENHFWFALASSDALLYAIGLAADLGWDVQLGEPDVSPVQIQGPASKDVVSALFGEDILSLKYYWFRELSLDGIPLIVTRTGWTAEVGYEIYLRDGSYGSALWERIMEAGKPFQIRPTGPSDIRRVEGGILNWGADMTLENNAFEVGLERLCQLDGDFEFRGKAALRRIRETGVSRKLVGVTIDGEPMDMNFTKWPIHEDGTSLGAVTTALWSPRLEANIGYAWLPVERAVDGNQVAVTTPTGERTATVIPMPFIDPDKSIPKAKQSVGASEVGLR